MVDVFIVVSEYSNCIHEPETGCVEYGEDILGFFDNFEAVKEYVDNFIKQNNPYIDCYNEYYKVYAQKVFVHSDYKVRGKVFADSNSDYYGYTVETDRNYKLVWVRGRYEKWKRY